MNKISNCEEKVMKIIWDATEDPDLRTTMNAVNEKFGFNWKPQTVSTFLARLIGKGFLTSYRKGRYAYYVPEISLEDYRREQINELVKLLYNGDVDAAKKDLK